MRGEELLRRQIPIGAEFVPGRDAVHFRVWAPQASKIEICLEDRPEQAALRREPDGYFSGFVEGLSAGAHYKYRIDGSDPFPDPASRFQPAGPHGVSEVVDPNGFAWTDAAWPGISLRGQV
ncbi:MAG: malto-oligosyltrehalose trehalohydrolase, partial [Bryobacteraceae bacterium]